MDVCSVDSDVLRTIPRLNILKNRDEKRQLQLLENKSLFPTTSSKPNNTATLHSMNKKFNKLFERIYNAFDLKEELVRNVIAYAKCLPIPGTSVIDRNVFDAQMQRHFNLTNSVLLERMYEVCSPYRKQMGVLEYIELICLFLTDIKDYKVQFVFNVYNTQGDGKLVRNDLQYFIQPMVSQVRDDNEIDICDQEDRPLKDFVNMLMDVIDRNHDGKIVLDEFRYLVAKDILMIECLGPCLPNHQSAKRFMELFDDKTNLEVTAIFRYERRISLCEPALRQHKGIQRYYPVTLELP